MLQHAWSSDSGDRMREGASPVDSTGSKDRVSDTVALKQTP